MQNHFFKILHLLLRALVFLFRKVKDFVIFCYQWIKKLFQEYLKSPLQIQKKAVKKMLDHIDFKFERKVVSFCVMFCLDNKDNC